MTPSDAPTISLVAGARPNFMKVKPILDSLEQVGAKVELVHTGQHYDAAMSDIFFEDLGIRKPDHHLGVGSASHAEQTAKVMVLYEQLLTEHPVRLTVRTSTEPPITITEGANRLVRPDPDRIRIAATEIRENPTKPRCPKLRGGHIADRITEVFLTTLADENRLRPTDLAG